MAEDVPLQYLNLEGFQKTEGDTSEAEQRLQASKWTTFGISLHKLLSSQGGNKKDVPAWVEEATAALAKGGNTTKGLWTEQANKDEMKKATEALIHGNKINWGDYNMLTISGVVKTFFLKLPVPLLTVELHDIWIGAAQDIFSNADEQVQFIKQIIDVLPNSNRETLKVIIKLFNTIYKSGSEENKKYIAPVWGPILLLRKSLHDFKTEISDACKLCHLLIKNFDTLFGGPKTKPSGPPPKWLAKINKDRLEKLQTYINKTNLVLAEIVKFGQENQIDVGEFKANFELMARKLVSVQEVVADEKVNLNHVIETYHLDKFYNYISDFHDALIQGKATNSLVRSFKSTRLRASFERLSLSCQYELVLFFQLADEMYQGALRRHDAYVKKAQEYFAQFITNDPQGKEMWQKKLGYDNFIAAWPNFIASYREVVGNIDKSLEQHLKRVLDNSDTGFVTIFRFSEFLKGFGPLNQSIANIKDVVNQDWFHGYMSSPEADKLLEACEIGTFLVRFSESDPGTCAINFKDPNGYIQRIKIEPSDEGYGVKEGNAFRYFPTIADMVTFYSSYLRFPFNDRLMDFPWFYGDLTVEETQIFLEYEPIGTFLIRFSSQFGCFTCSYMREDGICHCRLQRLPDGQIEFDGRYHTNIAHFIEINAKWLVYPYRNDNTVSSSQEEDESRRMTSLPFSDSVDEDEDRNIEYKDFFTVDNPDLGNEAKAKELMKNFCCDKMKQSDKGILLDHSIALGSARVEKVLKEIHKEVPTILATRKKKKAAGGGIFGKAKSPVSLDKHYLCPDPKETINVCKPYTITFTATNNTKQQVKFEVDSAVEINGRTFVAVDPPNGEIEKGKPQTFKVTVVLYKPVVAKKIVSICFTVEDGEEYYNLPLVLGCSKSALKYETPQDPFWSIQRDEFETLSKIGGGASAAVFRANLYGALVAVKKWDLGKRDDPPRDFMAELDVFKNMRHENLVLFIGACAETGTAFLITEFLKNGSLDSYLQKGKDKKPWKLKLNMAIDAAKGMRYVHSHNKIHRDMKSLNLLVDDKFNVKVADFGESREKDANMTQATGTYNWMAPEVLMSQNYTMKADVFSFGIILWELVVEQYPNRSMQEVQEGRVPAIPEKAWNDYPEFISIILMCCRLNPAKRPTFDTIVRQLKQCRQKLDTKKI